MNDSSWTDVVKAIVGEHWTNQESAVLLSRLPALLKQRGVEPQDFLKGRKLAQALEEDLPSDLLVIRSEQNPIVVGVVPSSASPAPPFSRYFSGTKINNVPPALWRAFTVPLVAGYRRFFSVSPSKYFDILGDAGQPDGSYEIDRSDILGEAPGTASSIHEKIERWKNDNNIKLEAMKIRSSGSQLPKELSDMRALSDALAELEDSDLQRISIPLDIVRKIILSTQKNRK